MTDPLSSRAIYDGMERAPARSYLRNIGYTREDLTLDSKWVGDVGESADLDTLRDDIDAFCGVLASDEEAKANNTIGKAIDTIMRTTWGAMVDIGSLITVVWCDLFKVESDVPLSPARAWTGLLVICAVCLLLLSKKLKAYEVVK